MIARVLFIALILFGSGCASKRVVVDAYLPALELPIVKRDELACLAPDAYARLVKREQLLRQRIITMKEVSERAGIRIRSLDAAGSGISGVSGARR